jgi:hypothetical protein
MNQQRGYRRPGQSSYARTGWWVAHFAEVLGGIAGFAGGMLLLAVGEMVAPRLDLGLVPLVTTVVGALGVRALVKRQPRR